MRRNIRLPFVAVMMFLVACISRARGPETPKVDENVEATQRLDTLPDGHGTAVVLTKDGYLLTCYHVVVGYEEKLILNIAVGDQPPEAYPAHLVLWDKDLDLAVVKVDRTFSQTVVLGDSDDAHLLDDVYSVGFPYDLGEIASKGYIKAIHYDSAVLELKDNLAVTVVDGEGVSGSGVYLVRNGKLIGLGFKIVWRGAPDVPLLVFGGAILVDDIRAFLDRGHIPYRTEFSQ